MRVFKYVFIDFVFRDSHRFLEGPPLHAPNVPTVLPLSWEGCTGLDRAVTCLQPLSACGLAPPPAGRGLSGCLLSSPGFWLSWALPPRPSRPRGHPRGLCNGGPQPSGPRAHVLPGGTRGQGTLHVADSPTSHRLPSSPRLSLQGTRKRNPPTVAASGAGTPAYAKDLGHKRSRCSRENCGLHWVLKSSFMPQTCKYVPSSFRLLSGLCCVMESDSVLLESHLTNSF